MSSEPNALPTELILTNSLQSIGKIYLDWMPQPGSHIKFQGTTYAVLERHHHYQYKIGGYRLQRASLHVQESFFNEEKSLIGKRWVMGNAECRYNAHSEIIRCAVNPQGPCKDCPHYEPFEIN